MSKIKSNENFIQMSKNESNLWDNAILEAEKQIQDARKKITHLKRSIESFKILRESDEPFLSANEGKVSRKVSPKKEKKDLK
jgi:hypothetical protein